jgi:hypothetical protein
MPDAASVLKTDDVCAGDVLLCVLADQDPVTLKLRAKIGPYTHAAIALGDGRVADANVKGVTESSLADLSDDCARIAVFRSDLWDADRLEKLDSFIGELERRGTRFNKRGMMGVLRARAKHVESAMEGLLAYIEAGSLAIDHFKNAFFCSELVVTAFAQVGIIGPKAEQILKPKVYTPPALGQDKVFGLRIGYILQPGQLMPSDDQFVALI